MDVSGPVQKMAKIEFFGLIFDFISNFPIDEYTIFIDSVKNGQILRKNSKIMAVYCRITVFRSGIVKTLVIH